MQNDNLNSKKNTSTDLPDSEKDKKELVVESFTVNLPDVSDIPGQENITPAPLGEMADDTISSADEEGDSIFNDDIDEDIDESTDSNVTRQEADDLSISANDMPTEDDENLRRAALDNTDNDGSPLNESSFKNNVTGTGLDVPGAENDDEDEEIGEEDEENNEYSLGGDNHD
ncbi:MAG: hypothetical protein ABI691_03240 [Ginsengibacter sp.]